LLHRSMVMKMKRIAILMLLAVAVSMGAAAEDPVVVATVRQITEDERNLIPAKTLEMKLQRVKWDVRGNGYLIDAIKAVIDTVTSNDVMNRTFEVIIDPVKGEGNSSEVAIAVLSSDVLEGGLNADAYEGVMVVERRNFVFTRTRHNAQLLKQLLAKDKGKARLVCEFEVVSYKVPPEPTSVVARYSGNTQWRIVDCRINETGEKP